MAEKSILEQALLQVQTLEEAVKQNAKGILASTMKEELNQMLKEEEEEEKVKAEEEEESLKSEQDMEDSDESDVDTDSPKEEDEEDLEDADDTDSDDEVEGDSENVDDLDNVESGDEDSMGTKDMDSDMEDEMNPNMGDDMDSNMEDDMNSDVHMGDDDVMDMTGASDEEVLRVFKAMKPEDGVVVKKDGNDVSLDTGEDEFIIKLDEETSEEEMSEELSQDDEQYAMEGDLDPDMDMLNLDDSSSMEEENVYEIELDEEEESTEEEKKVKKVETKEAARTKSNAHGNKGGAKRLGIKGKKVYRAGVPPALVSEQVENLKKQNTEYKKALVLFKEKLNEVAVFNANLAYATRLFTEHSTTKKEKLDILKRFDSVSTMNDSKNLYSSIKNELVTKKPVTESLVEKISASPKTSSSEVLSESKAYENPQFRRMKDLMAKIK
jgi:hypothetical protein